MDFLRRWMREPLVHFVALGGIIFLVWWGVHPQTLDERAQITVTAADVQRLRALAERQWGHVPEPTELTALVESYVREEVLYREALAAGLDRDDVVVRRRLVQKMDALAQNTEVEPSEAELMDFWKINAKDYAPDSRLSFQQIYFNPELRGEKAPSDARALLPRLMPQSKPQDGDPFMLSDGADRQTRQGIARDYGDGFAQRVATLPRGSWQGPLQSSLGVHLVRVEASDESSLTGFAAVRERVRLDWVLQRQVAAQEAAYRELRKRYHVDISAAELAGNGGKP